MLVWKAFDFSIKSEGESCWVEYFWLQVLPFITEIYCAICFWVVKFLLRNQLIPWWEFLCMLFSVFLLLLLMFYLCFYFFLAWLLWVSVCSSLGLSCLGLSVLPGLDYFLSHVREVFSYYFFKYFLRSFLSFLLGLL